MIVARTAAELDGPVPARRTFVPTMGALHEGHAQLIRHAAELGDPVVVSVFVNPTQFAPGEDFDRYPRDLDGDVELARTAGASAVYAPPVDEVYPPGFQTTVDPGPLGDELCGASRPGHFVGVATVVVRLFGLVRPERAVFGRKDRQQLVILQRVARDLALPVEVLGAPTVREADGLALSSRNRYLSDDERLLAATVPATLRSIACAYADGERDATALVAAADAPPFALEYLELRAPDLTDYVPGEPGVALIAGRVGTTRLIDNIDLDPVDPEAAVRLLTAKEHA